MKFAACELLLLGAAAAQLNAAAVRFEVIREKSSIAVRTDKAGILSAFGAGHRHGIIAGEFDARLCADPQTFEDASVVIRVPVSSLRIDTPEARRIAGVSGSGPGEKDVPVIQKKMLSPANLDAAAHPEIRFESAAVTRNNEGLNVRGQLTVRGRARPVSVPLRIERAGSDHRFSGQFEIKLTEYGITPESIGGVVKVADQVTILLDFLARTSTAPCK
jgi:polyisoprenoid-binding protein YceI